MQRITNDSGGGGSGGGGSVRLGRFKSAPATWLETLLEEDDDDPLIKQNQNLTELLISGGDASTKGGINSPLGSSSSSLVEPSMGCLFEPGNRFQRQNSSPADYFSSFEIPSSSYQYLSKSVDVSNSANSRLQLLPKGEYSGQGSAGVSGSMDMEMEKLLEDSVPCRVRAKRGCATHPRSIAERVRRTRISDRIRKLQELVPKMDKQTNTAEMLDEAVEYVKFLQKQIQELKEHRQKCKCTAKE